MDEFPENVYSSLSFLPPDVAVKIRSDIKYLGDDTMLEVRSFMLYTHVPQLHHDIIPNFIQEFIWF